MPVGLKPAPMDADIRRLVPPSGPEEAEMPATCDAALWVIGPACRAGSTWWSAAAWVAVAWLVVAHVLAERGRVHRDGPAYRAATIAAAATLIAVCVAAGVLPAAALGLLWLRAELFPHRDAPFPPGGAPARAAGLIGRGRAAVARLWRPVLRVAFRIEVVILVVVALVLVGGWVRTQSATFNNNSNATLCRLLRGC